MDGFGPSPWRLIPPFQARGEVHMAIDAWLLHQHRAGLHPPTLRFYTWSPAAISLGYHQRRYPNWDGLTWQGQPVELVRRPTGGRAVLHQGDLTYAVVTSGLKGTRRQIYEQLCQFLIVGLGSLQLPLQFGQAGRSPGQNCFSTATAADLVTPSGSKLIGSAQRYSNGAILQHGSIQLAPDPELYQRVFQQPPCAIALPPPLQCAEDERQRLLIQTLSAAAVETFRVQLSAQPLSSAEIERAWARWRIENGGRKNGLGLSG